ncbi:MAG: YebC/PmpR family DNA-binding transcriptional regulator [Candidatus Marinimicrobia bacterium]|nr:YebC/PmpR family DNA-binding transcriptional regulator [Candidatus Neomarinimicrobiota bacterium]
MAGHSKWAQIKRKKAVNDARRGKIFTKLIREIQVAAKLGGPDEDSNPRLRQAIQQAKAHNMPMSNIEKAIAKGCGEIEGVNYEEVVYEAYGPAGVAIYIEVLTDNKNRTVSEIRHILSKYGGNLATSGSVSWMFEKKGTITVKKNAFSEDDILIIATESGAEDINITEDAYEITTDPSNLESVKKAFEEKNVPILESAISMIPKNTVNVDENNAQKILSLVETLEDHDDVQKVYANFDIDEEILKKVTSSF